MLEELVIQDPSMKQSYTFVPVIGGSKSSGLMMVLGVALIAATGGFASFGIGGFMSWSRCCGSCRRCWSYTSLFSSRTRSGSKCSCSSCYDRSRNCSSYSFNHSCRCRSYRCYFSFNSRSWVI